MTNFASTLKWFRSKEDGSHWYTTDREFRITSHGHLGFFLARRNWNYTGEQQTSRYPVISQHAKLAEAKSAAVELL